MSKVSAEARNQAMYDPHLYLCVAAIARDEDYECRCGQPPYDDSNMCPRCLCILTLDTERERLKTVKNYSDLSIEELIAERHKWHVQHERMETLTMFVETMQKIVEAAVQDHLTKP